MTFEEEKDYNNAKLVGAEAYAAILKTPDRAG